VDDVDLDACRIRITEGKGAKDRTVLFPSSFKETLAVHIDAQRAKAAAFLFHFHDGAWTSKPIVSGWAMSAALLPWRG
jgi:integrase/recombinase XerD